MEEKWIFDKDFDSVISDISKFKSSESDFVIKPLQVKSDSVLFGCYIPTIPRPTSIISGKILIKRLADNRTELKAINFQDWALLFLKILISSLSGGD
ncbi:MAG: hypothetical protein WBV22_06620 [Anaerolineaceae bacterium]